VLNVQSASLVPSGRPRAVVVEHQQGRPDGAALLSFTRRGPATAVTVVGDGVGPVPGGGPASRLYARDDDVARELSDGIREALDRLRGPWTMRLGGLPLGDPTLRYLAAALPSASLANARSRRLVDELDSVADVVRTTDPSAIDHGLPAVLDRLPARDRAFVRACARVLAAVGGLELAVVRGDGAPAALVLTLLDPVSGDRWPWWGTSEVGGLRRELGSPVVTLTASSGLRVLSRRTAPR
jgi:hypothetical protein